MLEIVHKFERIIYGVLIAMLMIVLSFAIVELGWIMFTSLINPPVLILENHELVNVLGVFLLVLIAVELLDTIVAYFKENTIHVEIVVLLALIAISRKVILLDPAQSNPVELIGIGIMVIGLAGAFFLVKKAGVSFTSDSK